jgi:hypothetical protein
MYVYVYIKEYIYIYHNQPTEVSCNQIFLICQVLNIKIYILEFGLGIDLILI